MSLLGLEGNGGLVFMLVADIAILAWIIMLAAGGLWSRFGILSPISYWTSVLIGAAVMIGAFAMFLAARRV